MSYTLNPDGSVTLDTGATVSVAVTRERIPNSGGVAFTATATLLGSDGAPSTDAAGEIASAVTHNADTAQLAQGEDAIARALLLTVLGEPQDTIPFADDFRANASIRNHIAAAAVPAIDPAALLG